MCPSDKVYILSLSFGPDFNKQQTENDSVPQRAEKARANKGQKAQDFGLTVN